MLLAEHLWMDAAALGLALIWDIVLGEPPAAVHPVVWVGKLIGWLDRRAPKSGRVIQLCYGLGMALAIPGAFFLAGYFLLDATTDLHPVVYILIAGFLLKCCFSVRGLEQAANAVKKKLEAGDVARARTDLCALVSRDTSGLEQSSAASAAVESVAENTTDSFVAPGLAFAFFGLPGALAYRAINTLDAMIGYHGKYEYLGKASARLDDAVNFIPARLSAIIIVAASPLRAHSSRNALVVMSREGSTTESPNAGLTMAAMAGALGVELEKAGHYRLGSGQRRPDASDISESIRVMQLTAVIACCLTFAMLMVRHAVW